jgi:hypothetical protein
VVIIVVDVWVQKGLIVLTDDNKINQSVKNIAYFAELYMQVPTDDPENANRISKQKRMVFLSNPPTTNPLYPVAVVNLISFIGGNALGREPVRFDYMIQVSIIGKKAQNTNLEQLMSNMMKAIKVGRDDLHDVGMYYVRDSIPGSFQPFVRDSVNPELLIGSATFGFYSIL